jgi:hypothetical protein
LDLTPILSPKQRLDSREEIRFRNDAELNRSIR